MQAPVVSRMAAVIRRLPTMRMDMLFFPSTNRLPITMSQPSMIF